MPQYQIDKLVRGQWESRGIVTAGCREEIRNTHPVRPGDVGYGTVRVRRVK